MSFSEVAPTPPHSEKPTFPPPNTPGNECFTFYEPSSALVSRIIRAQDNPSPPPVSPSSKVSFTNDTRLVDISEPTTPWYPNAQPPGHAATLLTTPPSPSLLCALPSHQSLAQPNADLITFDDELVVTSMPTSSHHLDRPGSPGARSTSDVPEPCKETGSPLVSPSNTEGVGTPQHGDPLTPVRRSGRIRKSVTPYQTVPLTSLEDNTTQVNSPMRTMPQASNAQTRIKKKNVTLGDAVESSRHSSPNSLDKQQSEIPGHEQNQDSSNAGHDSHHRLSSLSPTSSYVLSHLITRSRDEAPQYPKPSACTEMTPTIVMPPVDLQEILSKESIHSGSPRRDQSPSKTAQIRTPARRILMEETLPSCSKPANTFPSMTSASHVLSVRPSRTSIFSRPSNDSPMRRMANATNNSTGTSDDNTSSTEPLQNIPRRQLPDRSPTLPPAQFRTPARRIMVEEAQASSNKPFNTFPHTAASSNIGIARTPMFRIHSPARRVTINDTVTDGSEHARYDSVSSHSPIRRTTVRSHSEEPSTTKATVKSRCNSVEPRSSTQPGGLAFSRLAGLRAPPTKPRGLPFPLIHEAIPEESVKSSALACVPNQRTSKIPRIRPKPYDRPTPVTRVVIHTRPNHVQRAEPPTQTALSSQKSARGNLARDKTSIHGIVSARRAANPPTPASNPKMTLEDIPVPTKEIAPLLGSMHGPVQQTTRMMGAMEKSTLEHDCTTAAEKVQDRSDCNQYPIEGVDDVPEQSFLKTSSEEKFHLHLDGFTPVLNPAESPASNHKVALTPKGRRITRSRKNATPTTSKSTSQSSLSRRRVNNSTRDRNVFNSMSAVALKALTNSNTVRNQQYIAAKIETEVIRKSGFRPTSPTIKIQTILQRTQDEKCRERRERAQRRAQRNEEVDTQQQSMSPTFVALHLDIDHDTSDSEKHSGYHKGAGDDEGYQTPDSQSKKRKIANGSEHSEARAGRRVKWDKGLYTEIRLDEIQLGARLLNKHSATLKGCLAPTSKAVHLDTMGNLPTAMLPVESLVEECIVVKKFVYDDDEESEAAPPIALGTRSKVKKSKT